MKRTDYEKLFNRLGLGGFSVAKRRDHIANEKLSAARNIRVYSSGEIRPRKGLGSSLASAATSSTSLHTLRRFNDPATAAYKFILGAADKAYILIEGGAPTLLVSGLSGKKLQCVFTRPARSAKTWSYLTDQTGMYKLSYAGDFQNWAITGLNTPITAVQGAAAHKIIDNCDSATGWSNGGAAGAVGGPTSRLSFSIAAGPTAIVYDFGTTGWCVIVPGTMTSSFQPGALLRYNSGGGNDEQAYIESIAEQITSTTIESITYDSGTTGLATAKLTTATSNLAQDCVIKLTTGADVEYVRVIEVIPSSTHTPTIRIKTTLTHAAATVVDGAKSYRTYLANNHVAGETVASSYLQLSNTTSGTGYITKTSALDLLVSTTTPVVPFTPDDYIHVSLRVSDPSVLTEIQVLLDVDGATNDFTRNYYYYAIQPSAFSTSATTLTATQVDLQRQTIIGYQVPNDYSNYNNYSGYDEYNRGYQDQSNQGYAGQINYGQTSPQGIYTEPVYSVTSNASSVSDAVAGTSQWTELKIKLSDFKRIGSDGSRGWKDIQTIRLQAVSTAAVTVDLDSWFVCGGRNLYTGIGADYNWVIVARNRNTGDQSLPSPPLRQGLNITNNAVTGSFTSLSDTQVTDYDVYRFGGTLLDFYYVMSIPATTPGATLTFVDNYGDEALQINPILSRESYPVFPQLDQPKAGEATLKGTLLTRTSGDNFSTSWAAGSQINLTDSSGNAHLCKLYARPYTTTSLEIDRSTNLSGALKWSIPEPVLLGEKVSSIWGPYGGGGDSTYIFGAGSLNQPGTLFWTNPNNPGSASLRNQLEITSPQEPLIGGCLYDGQCFVSSTERMFRVFATGQPDNPFNAQEVANSKGLVSPHCITVGQVIYFVGKDGLYASTGGQPYSLTDRDLYPLFPHDSQAGEAVNGVSPPDYAYKDNFTLTHFNDFLYFTYRISGGDYRTLVFDTSRASSGAAADMDEVGRWISLDDHSPQVALHYGEEGTVNPRLLGACLDGKIYPFDSNTDAGTGFTYSFETKSWDFGVPGNIKFIPQFQLDCDLGGLSASVYARTELSTSTTLLSTVTNSVREIEEIPLPQSPIDLQQLLSLGIFVSGITALTATPKFHALIVDHSEVTPDANTTWFTQSTTNGSAGWNHFRDAFIAYKASADVTLTIIADGTRTYIYTLPSTGGQTVKTYLPLCAIKWKIFDARFTSSVGFKLLIEDSEFRFRPWGSEGPYNILRPGATL